MQSIRKPWCIQTRSTDHGTVMTVRLCTLLEACECKNPECCGKCLKKEVEAYEYIKSESDSADAW